MRLGVGVVLLDYTKGILERFEASKRFLELNPDWVGKLNYVQIARPKRAEHRRVPVAGRARALP
ncbi:MAG: trehalose-6-phosphate synthase [Betaproteobacteria bacterium]|nr:trehalose-6-phosphate synthase [Betaproteobacteria bacterium]